jgi:NADH-quinone oxidoreductase subunit J
MTFGDWISQTENVVFATIGIVMLLASVWVVYTKNVVHAALSLVVTLTGSAALFLLLGAEFVAWTVVLVYIGAVIILFLFGIMITRAPIGRDSAEGPTRTAEIGQTLFSRFVIPFEAVSFVLLAALIGGIVLARRDPS